MSFKTTLAGIVAWAFALLISYGLWQLWYGTAEAGNAHQWGALLIGGIAIWVLTPFAAVAIIMLVIVGLLLIID